jgi:hypothetical protein
MGIMEIVSALLVRVPKPAAQQLEGVGLSIIFIP